MAVSADPARAKRLFNFIILANTCLYLEAGAVPALLVELARTFNMSKGQQGLLGGVVYLAISVGGPFAGYSFKNFHQKKVLGYSLMVNNTLLFLLALCPDGWAISSWLFIGLRGLLGLTQCFLCVYSPIWIDEFSPSGRRTSWMSFIQAAVPIGIMGGYAMASMVIWATKHTGCGPWHCWRFPFLMQALIEVPFVVGLWMTPSSLVCVRPPSKKYRGPGNKDGYTPMSSRPSTPGSVPTADLIKMAAVSLEKQQGPRLADVSEGEVLHDTGAIVVPPPNAQRLSSRGWGMLDGYEGETEDADDDDDEDLDEDQPALSQSLPLRLALRKHMRQSSINRALYSPALTADSLDQFDRLPSSEDLTQLVQSHLEKDSSDMDAFFPPDEKEMDVYRSSMRKVKSATYRDASSSFTMRRKRMSSRFSDTTDDVGDDDVENRVSWDRTTLAKNGMKDEAYLADYESNGTPNKIMPQPIANGVHDVELNASQANRPRSPWLQLKNAGGSRRSPLPSPTASLAHWTDTDGTTSPGRRRDSMSLDRDRRSFSGAQLLYLFKDMVYVMLVFSISSLYFVVTGVQYWGTTYLLVALNGDQVTVNLLFIVVASTSPTAGVFFGGWLVDRCGGYRGLRQRIKALRLCFILGSLSTAAGIPATFTKNIYVCASLLWVLLFFGGSLLPACTGILVSIVPRKMRELSTACSLVIFNLFGYSMSLVLSGYVMEAIRWYSLTHELNCNDVCVETWGFRVVLFWPSWSLIMLLGAIKMSQIRLRRREEKLQRKALPSTAPSKAPSNGGTEKTPLLAGPHQRHMDL